VSRPDSLHECLRDTVCRIIAVREYLEVGDYRLAAIVLADLEDDLAGLVAYLDSVSVAA
jgi:hypothetical protein